MESTIRVPVMAERKASRRLSTRGQSVLLRPAPVSGHQSELLIQPQGKSRYA